MPFTFAHIGYILPLQKKWREKLSITGLIFGSIAPDYDFLFRLTNVREHLFQYDLPCIFFIIYPLALISALSFHFFCKNIVFENLPVYFQQKYRECYSVDFFASLKSNFLRLSYSIIFAILLHLFLDFLCHFLNAYEVKMYVLQYIQNDTIGNIAYFSGCYALPVLFSIIGIYLFYMYEFDRPISLHYFLMTKKQLIFWTAIFLNTIVLCSIKLCLTETNQTFLIDFFIIAITSAFIFAFYLTCLLFYFFQKIRSYA